MNTSLRSKLSLAMITMVCLSIVVSSFVAGKILWNSYRDSVRHQLQAASSSLISLGIESFAELKDFEQFNTFLENSLEIDRVDKIIRIYNSQQDLIFTSLGKAHDPFPAKLARKFGQPVFLTMSAKNRNYESVIVPYKQNRRLFYLQIVMPLPQYKDIWDSLKIQSVLSLAIMMLIATIFSFLFAKRLSHPVQRIAQHLEELDPASIHQWKFLDVSTQKQYLDPITNGVNLMIERTQRAVSRLRKMSRYVAHELRTPLTIMQGEAELLLQKKNAEKEEYQAVLASSLEEIHRMSDIITTVLQVSEVENAARAFQPQHIQLATWLENELPLWEKLLQRQIPRNYYGNKRLVLFANAKLLHRLLDNYFRNILVHTPKGAPCQLELLADSQHNGHYLLLITDFGEGMAEEKIAVLQSGKTTELSGIGLNLCQRIAEILGLKISYNNLSQGGFQVQISLPRELLRVEL